MLKKMIRVILITVFIISLIKLSFCAVKDIKVRDWHKTTLTVTFIGLPDGTVFGDYTDANGQYHQNEPVFHKSSFFGYHKDVEQYYGKAITILDDPATGEVLNYDDLFPKNILYLGLAVISGVLLFISIKYRKRA